MVSIVNVFCSNIFSKNLLNSIAEIFNQFLNIQMQKYIFVIKYLMLTQKSYVLWEMKIWKIMENDGKNGKKGIN